jgi:hypothetical protein
LRTVIFTSESVPEIGSDVFGNTWDYSDFAIYVPAAALDDFKDLDDGYWQSYVVSNDKLHGYTTK